MNILKAPSIMYNQISHSFVHARKCYLFGSLAVTEEVMMTKRLLARHFYDVVMVMYAASYLHYQQLNPTESGNVLLKAMTQRLDIEISLLS